MARQPPSAPHLVAELEALTLAIADAGPRVRRRPAVTARETRQTTT
jgi:hypothetical protein